MHITIQFSRHVPIFSHIYNSSGQTDPNKNKILLLLMVSQTASTMLVTTVAQKDPGDKRLNSDQGSDGPGPKQIQTDLE